VVRWPPQALGDSQKVLSQARLGSVCTIMVDANIHLMSEIWRSALLLSVFEEKNAKNSSFFKGTVKGLGLFTQTVIFSVGCNSRIRHHTKNRILPIFCALLDAAVASNTENHVCVNRPLGVLVKSERMITFMYARYSLCVFLLQLKV
jgi:hypothetical protein